MIGVSIHAEEIALGFVGVVVHRAADVVGQTIGLTIFQGRRKQGYKGVGDVNTLPRIQHEVRPQFVFSTICKEEE